MQRNIFVDRNCIFRQDGLLVFYPLSCLVNEQKCYLCHFVSLIFIIKLVKLRHFTPCLIYNILKVLLLIYPTADLFSPSQSVCPSLHCVKLILKETEHIAFIKFHLKVHMYCKNEISSIIDKLSIILSHPVNILKFSFFLLTQTFTESYSSAIDHVLIESFAPLFSFRLLGFGIPFFVFMNQHNQRVKKNIFPSIKTKKESFNVQKILKWQNWYLQKYNMRKVTIRTELCKLETIMIIF